jgi:hypothetical protein
MKGVSQSIKRVSRILNLLKIQEIF